MTGRARRRFVRADDEWITRAKCAGMPLARFYSSDRATIRAARHLCAGCPVRPACLRAVLAFERMTPGRFGFCGGLTAAERAELHPATVAVILAGKAA